MRSTMCAGRPCRPANFAIATTALSGAAPNSRPGRPPWRPVLATPSASRRSAPTTRKWARRPKWRSLRGPRPRPPPAQRTRPMTNAPTSAPFSLPRKIYAGLVGLAGIGAVLAGLAGHPLSGEQWVLTGVLAALSVVLDAVGATLPGASLAAITYVSLESTAYYTAMILINPWAAGLVAIPPSIRWRLTNRQLSNWAAFRNAGMTALMAIGGGLAYQWAGGAASLAHLTGRDLLALALAIVVVRVINEVLALGANSLANNLRHGLVTLRVTQRAAWAVEAIAYIPTLLTVLIYTRLGWAGLAVWLLVFSGGAFALYSLSRARGEVAGRLTDLSTANTHMAAHEQRAATLAGRLNAAAEELTNYASRLVRALEQQHASITQVTSTV